MNKIHEKLVDGIESVKESIQDAKRAGYIQPAQAEELWIRADRLGCDAGAWFREEELASSEEYWADVAKTLEGLKSRVEAGDVEKLSRATKKGMLAALDSAIDASKGK